jgi:cytochrome c peroxidase
MRGWIVLAAALLLGGCGGGSGGGGTPVSKADLGERLFFDKNLSFNRTQSCATCHNPDHGFVDARSNPAMDGVKQAVSLGDDGTSLGERNAPTAAYAHLIPAFHFNETLNRHKGGQFLDGRSATLKDQAMGPPLNPVEMDMPDKASVVDRLREKPGYVRDFKALFGADIFSDDEAAYEAMAEAIAAFEKTDRFSPFDSKYDRYLACLDSPKKSTNACIDEVGWTAQEDLGMSLFFSEENRNCITCHTLGTSTQVVSQELFTNHEYHNIGVPPNPDLTHLESGFIDRGLGGALDDATHDGKFRVPTLRNVAVTGPYMHNGVFKDLKTVVAFYESFAANANHTINPETGVAWAEAEVPETVNLTDMQAINSMSETQVEALVAFMKTLTDRRYEHLLED